MAQSTDGDFEAFLSMGIVDKKDEEIVHEFPINTKNFEGCLRKAFVDFSIMWLKTGPHRRWPAPLLFFKTSSGKKFFVKPNAECEKPLVLSGELFTEKNWLTFFARVLLAFVDVLRDAGMKEFDLKTEVRKIGKVPAYEEQTFLSSANFCY